MNSLIILPAECVDSTRAVLTGSRARYAVEVHGVVVGARCRLAVLGVARGEGVLIAVSAERVEVDIISSLEPLARMAVDVVVGISRPQTVKKVIQAATMLGVRSLHFVRTELGEKSYLQSKALRDNEITLEGAKALEQVWDSHLPHVQVHRSFSYFVDHHLPQLGDGIAAPRLLAQPGAPAADTVCRGSHFGNGAVIGIGSELGWSKNESDTLSERGFRVIGLGGRVLRVEIALVLLLGQLQLLLGDEI